MEALGTLLFYVGWLIAAIGGIWMLVEMFKTSVGWGIMGIICGPAWIFWLIGHWEDGKRPFLIALAGTVLYVTGALTGGRSLLDAPGMGGGRDKTELAEILRQKAEEAKSEEPQTPRDEGLAQAQNSAAATNAAMQDGMPAPAPEPPPAAPVPAPAGPPMPGGETTHTAESAPAAVPAMPPDATPAPTPMPTFTPPPVIVDGLPVASLWTRYFEAAQMIDQGNPAGVDALQALVSAGDAEWFDKNAMTIAAIVLPNSDVSNAANARLVAAQALLRSMPLKSDRDEPFNRTLHAVGVGKVTARLPDGSLASYTTPIVQENGRWVIARYFFARDFVWTPQLATHKRAKNIPLGADEQEFVAAGFAPMQARAQAVLSSVGMGGR